MGPPEKKEHLKKAEEATDVTTKAKRPPNLSASRRPHYDSASSMPTPSRKYQEPKCASEPPKISARKNVQPTTQSKESSKYSTAGSKKAGYDNQNATRSKASGDSRQLPDEASLQARKMEEPSYHTPLSQKDIKEIERQTRGQQNNQDWHHWRHNRITASLAHKIAHSKFANEKTSDIPQSYLKTILGTGPKVQTTAMNWGIRNEKRAVRTYEKQASENKGREVHVEDCGLFIHPSKNWLAASPDGIVTDKKTGEALGILEVKCPYKHKEHTVREACKDPDFCLNYTGDSYALKPNHAYYTQVQCQMASTGMRNADFVVHTNKDTVTVPVIFDPEFWEETEPKLEKFYKEAVMPQIKKLDLARKGETPKSIHAPEE